MEGRDHLTWKVSEAVDVVGPGSLEVQQALGPPLDHGPSPPHVVHLTEHLTHTHTRTHADTHACTHARTHTHTHWVSVTVECGLIH